MVALLLAVMLAAGSAPHHRVVTVTDSIEILDPVEFAPATDRLKPGARHTVDAVAHVLTSFTTMKRIAVVAYGPAALAQKRAQAVVAQLVADGVAPERLVAQTA